MAHRAEHSLAGGVTSSWQITAPQPVWLSHGQGSKVYDVDGNEYVDLHGGYGAALAGHAHPAIVEAVHSQVGLGTHFAQPTQNAIAVGGGTRPPVRPAAVAVRQLRHRGHHGRRAPDAVDHRPGPDHQDRGLLPRPPRLGAGLGDPRGRTRSARRTGPPRSPPARGIPEAIIELTLVATLQRPGQRGPAARRAPGPGRRDDHRADHDERGDHRARARLPGRAEGPAALPRRPAHLRRGQDRPDRRARAASPG